MTSDLLKESYLIHPAVKYLKKYDKKNKTNYLETLREYLNCALNTTEAVDRLFIHRNTLYYRLKKIEELCEIDLTDMPTIVCLYFAIANENLI